MVGQTAGGDGARPGPRLPRRHAHRTASRALSDNRPPAVTAKPDVIGNYLLSHGGLQPVSEQRAYGAVQDGRFVFDVDRKGMFSLRRR